MSSIMYDTALEQFLQAALDLTSVTVMVQPVDSSYVASASDVWLDPDVPTGALLGTAVEVTTKSITAGLFSGLDDVTFTDVPDTLVIAALLFYVDIGGDPTTSPLLCYIDTQVDTTPINLTSDGTNIVASWPSGIFRI